MTEIGNVVFSVEKIDQLKAEIERLREIIRKAHLAATCESLTLEGYKPGMPPVRSSDRNHRCKKTHHLWRMIEVSILSVGLIAQVR
jgi:VanZ family protein